MGQRYEASAVGSAVYGYFPRCLLFLEALESPGEGHKNSGSAGVRWRDALGASHGGRGSEFGKGGSPGMGWPM